MRRLMLLGFSCWLAAIACGGGTDNRNDGRPDAGAGSDAGSSADAGATDAGVATHNFTLTTPEVRLRKRFGFSTPADGHVFIDVKLALSNTGEARPLSISPFRFSLETNDALIYGATGLGSSLPKACPTNVSLAIGGQLTCRVGFDILASEIPSALLYLDPAEPVGRDANVPIATVLPALPSCSYWQLPLTLGCVNCVVSARMSGSGNCQFAFSDTVNACQFACLTADSCSQLVSTCTPSAACTTALDRYQACIYDNCLSSCPLAE